MTHTGDRSITQQYLNTTEIICLCIPLLIWSWIERIWIRSTILCDEGPPDLNPTVLIDDLLILAQTEEQGLAILDIIRLHASGFHGGLVTEVGFDGGVNLTPIEAIVGVLRKSYSQVRGEVIHQFVSISWGIKLSRLPYFWREVVLIHRPEEHQRGQQWTELRKHVECDHFLSRTDVCDMICGGMSQAYVDVYIFKLIAPSLEALQCLEVSIPLIIIQRIPLLFRVVQYVEISEM